jgi:hypothetical protein
MWLLSDFNSLPEKWRCGTQAGKHAAPDALAPAGSKMIISDSSSTKQRTGCKVSSFIYPMGSASNELLSFYGQSEKSF